jgi:small GTP-binding protein
MQKEAYSEEAQRVIAIIERKYNIDWNNQTEREKVTALDLSNSQISDISALQTLTNLVHLDLRYNEISDISALQRLTNLTTLDLRYNQISDISALQTLTNLTDLYLSNNQISDINALQTLTNLTTLYLRNNQISDISALQTLTNLTDLYLSNNQISDISALQRLTNLTHLYLGSNKISDISTLQKLINLRNLHLNSNQISDTSALQMLTNLATLRLGSNQIKSFPKELLRLHLEVNIKKDYGRGSLFLEENPIESPPLEVMAQGNKAIAEYFKALEEEKRELNELKILFVGDGGAGKTSLIKKMLFNNFDKHESMTHGIRINDKALSIDGVEIRAHFWDFGGQEMMHSTHQFFLSTRSLYVLVLDGRKEEDSEYWLNFTKSFGGNSPILVVLNKIDENEGFELNRKFLKEKYPNIISFYRTSCVDGRGVKEFYGDLKKAMLKVELIKTKWGKSWFEVKSHIEALEENFINRDTFIEICNRYSVESSAHTILAKYLDDLGIALYFEDFNLKEIHTLKPEWVTNGVYTIITSKKLGDSRGIVDINAISQLLPTANYPSHTHRYIIELMKKFELCYQLENTLLIPSRFELQEPLFEFKTGDALRFEFQYSFLPLSIIDTFIVKSHNDIKENLRWRTGVLLEDKSTQAEALIRVDNKEKNIAIFVNGGQKRDFFAVIRKRFHEINSKFKEIIIDELIPLPNHPKVKVKYKELIGYEKARRDDYFNGELGESFSVSKLLNGIEKPESREHTNVTNNHFYKETTVGDTNVTIGDNNQNLSNFGNDNRKTLSNVGNNNSHSSISVGGDNSGVINTGDNTTITQTTTSTTNELDELFKQLKQEVATITSTLDESEKKKIEKKLTRFEEDVKDGDKEEALATSKGLIKASEVAGKIALNIAKYSGKILEML